MREMLRKIGLGVVLGTMLLGGGMVAMESKVVAKASNICEDEVIKKRPALLEAAGCNVDEDATFMSTASALISIVLSLMGLLAVGVIVYGGITYATSTGDTGKATKARNIIIYGVAGLVVSLLAWAIVHFVSLSVSK